jgi:hypothetical protein
MCAATAVPPRRANGNEWSTKAPAKGLHADPSNEIWTDRTFRENAPGCGLISSL